MAVCFPLILLQGRDDCMQHRVWWFGMLPNSATVADYDDGDDDDDVFCRDQSSVDTALTHSGQRLGLSCTVLLESCEEQRPDSRASSDVTSPPPAVSHR